MHEAADGPLARVRLPGGVISADRLRELAACASELGSGVIELTSRANVQVRGLRSPVGFAARMAAAGLLPSASHERVRNIVASPLAGRGPAGIIDPDPVVAALDAGLCARPRLASLPGRFLFAVDDGTGDVAALDADLTFAGGDRLLIGGLDLALPATPTTAAAHLLAAAEAFLDERGDTPAWHITDLPNGPSDLHHRLTRHAVHGTGEREADASAPTGRGVEGGGKPWAGAVPGVVRLRDERLAVVVGVPLGRLSADQGRVLAGLSPVVRVTPWRTVVLADLAEAGPVTGVLAAAGLVTDPESPWVGVSACTGRPGCARALADVRADAARWVAGRTARAEDPVHWAGCERRCGLPRGRVIEMVANGIGYDERRK
ncbi:precorrin-3B synthase [Spongiactinospora sp. TRM90649]|uniref:precorrin-3B synthase n=1 Tax=Spongiactinospora sp. TRM90649 TaxID=3031114 RepID=UPI0023F9F060|nr:precorrin-3B synthase [Spongiactinospora sp. TRM90649]MDF5754199.1 precorrin-3B synthase [Spongiactinospora sp. TRM90649]